jgi:hypothetical protein
VSALAKFRTQVSQAASQIAADVQLRVPQVQIDAPERAATDNEVRGGGG